MITIRAAALSKFVSDIFVKAGTSRAQGDRLGESLVGANLAGHDSHGVIMLPSYLDRIEKKPDVSRKRYEALLEKDPKNEPAMLGLVSLLQSLGKMFDHLIARRMAERIVDGFQSIYVEKENC